MGLIINIFLFVILLKAYKKSGMQNYSVSTISSGNLQKIYKILAIAYLVISYIAFVVENLEVSVGPDEMVYFATAKSIATNGVDLQGYKLPCYNVTWNWGTQSILYTYIAAGFMKIFGISLVVFRLPLYITSVFAIINGVSHYRNYYGLKKVIWLLIYLCSSPIILYAPLKALDSAFIFPLFTLAFTLLDKGIKAKKHRYFYIAAFIFGLLYYVYALSLPFVTLFLLLFAVYYISKYKRVREIAISALIVLLIGYCGIVGWFSVITDIKLPNLLEYPISDITRTNDVGLSPTKIYFLFKDLSRALGMGVYDYVCVEFFSSGICLPRIFVLQLGVFMMIALYIIYKKNIKIDEKLCILLLIYGGLEICIITGSDIRLYYIIIPLVLSFVFVMIRISRKYQVIVLVFLLLENMLYGGVMLIDKVKIDRGTNKAQAELNTDFVAYINYFKQENIQDVQVLVDDIFVSENVCCLNIQDYIYTLANAVYIFDDRETVKELKNDKSIYDVYDNYTFYIENNEDIITLNEDYNLVMNSIKVKNEESYRKIKSTVYTLYIKEQNKGV